MKTKCMQCGGPTKMKKMQKGGGGKNKTYTNPQDGRVMKKADRIAKLLDETKTGVLSREGYQKKAEYANWTNKPRMHYGTINKKSPTYPEIKEPIWYDPDKPNLSKGGSKKKLTKAQKGGIAGFGSLGKVKNTMSQTEMTKLSKEGAAQAKKRKEANKKFNADIKSGKIKLAGVSKNKK